MNAPTRSEFQIAMKQREGADERMDQIRELLFGEQQKLNDDRFVELTLRLREIEATVTRRLDTLQARLDALASEVKADQRSAFDEISRGVEELGARIRHISRD
jgi:hypothetical protein